MANYLQIDTMTNYLKRLFNIFTFTMLNENSILAFDFQFSPVILETNLTVKD